MLTQDAAHKRANHKAKPERRAQHSVADVPPLRRRDIGDVRVAHRDRCTADPVDRAGDEQEQEIRRQRSREVIKP